MITDSYTRHHKHPNLETRHESKYQAEKGYLTRNVDFKFVSDQIHLPSICSGFVGDYLT